MSLVQLNVNIYSISQTAMCQRVPKLGQSLSVFDEADTLLQMQCAAR